MAMRIFTSIVALLLMVSGDASNMTGSTAAVTSAASASSSTGGTSGSTTGSGSTGGATVATGTTGGGTSGLSTTGGNGTATTSSTGSTGSSGSTTVTPAPTPAPTAAPTSGPTPAPTPAPTAGPTTTTVAHTTFTGTISITATGVSKAQMEAASRSTLAIHFGLELSQVVVDATESRRLLGDAVSPRTRRLAGNWAVKFTISAPAHKVAHIATKSENLKADTSVFTSTLGTQLMAAGVPASAVASLKVTGVTVVQHAPGGGNQTTNGTNVTTTTTAVPQGSITNDSSKAYLSMGLVATIMMALLVTSNSEA